MNYLRTAKLACLKNFSYALLQMGCYGLGALCLLAACGDRLERYSEVQDLRILAIAAEPPEIFTDPLNPADNDITFTALVVDPNGGELTYQWRLCPVESSRACRDYERFRSAVDSPSLRQELDAIHDAVQLGTALPLDQSLQLADNERQAQGVWPYDIPPYAFSPTFSFFLYHLQTSGFGGLEGAWPTVVLGVENAAGDTLVGQKRLVVNVRDPAAFAGQAAEEFGITLCPSGKTPDDVPGCLLLPVRQANRNPVFADIRLVYSQFAKHDDFLPFVGIPEVRAGGSVRILPVFTEDSEETFSRLRADLQTLSIEVDEAKEELSVAWFVSAGQVSDALTWPKFTRSLDTRFTAPKAPPENTNGLVTIWMVAQDQRGGTAWHSIELRVVP